MMADRKKAKGKRKTQRGDDVKLTKIETTIAKYLRFNCPSKSTTLLSEDVYYFTASKAVDTLLESKWGNKAKKDPIFTNRQSVVVFLEGLLTKGLFWRARKLVPKRKERPIAIESSVPASGGKEKRSVDDEKLTKSPKKLTNKKEQRAVAKAASITDSPVAKKETSCETKNDEKKISYTPKQFQDDDEKRKKKKIKLDYHNDQIFIDGSDVYVWVFDPTPWTKWLIGLGLVFGAIAVCLFPLWPPWVRMGIYYLSLVGLGLFGVLLGVAICRTILFGIIWCVTFGVHHFWLLPNLTEDCGFFESFKPLYSYKYCPKTANVSCKTKLSSSRTSSNAEDDNKSEKDQHGNTDSDRNSDSIDDESDDDNKSDNQQTTIDGDVRQRRKKTIDDDFEMVEK